MLTLPRFHRFLLKKNPPIIACELPLNGQEAFAALEAREVPGA
jgi:hypothetical protein